MGSIRQFILRTICIICTSLAFYMPSIFGTHSCEICNSPCEHVGGTATCAQRAICSECGEEYGAIIPHTAGEKTIENKIDATCEVDGSYDEVIYCLECDSEISRATIKVRKLYHKWDDGVIAAEATCDNDSQKKITCLNCGFNYTESNENTALGHDYGEWYTETEPTCSKAGQAKRDCSRCDSSETKAIAKTKHEVTVVAGSEPTCTKPGLTAGKVCSVCDEIISVQLRVHALGHSFTNYVSNNDATDTADGTKTAKCDRCDATDTIVDEGSKLDNTNK